MKFRVRFTAEAREDLEELHAFLAERDLGAAERAIETLTKAWEVLERFPFSCRKAKGAKTSPFLRELVIPFGQRGDVALFTIDDSRTVTVLAVRHQREADFH
jgi:plasmid stabilization system protein ParE